SDIEFERNGSRGLMRMLGPGVDLQLLDHLAAETVLREHAAHGALDDRLGATPAETLEGLGLDAAGEAGMAVVDLGAALVGGHRDLLGVDHDDEIAGVRSEEHTSELQSR